MGCQPAAGSRQPAAAGRHDRDDQDRPRTPMARRTSTESGLVLGTVSRTGLAGNGFCRTGVRRIPGPPTVRRGNGLGRLRPAVPRSSRRIGATGGSGCRPLAAAAVGSSATPCRGAGHTASRSRERNRRAAHRCGNRTTRNLRPIPDRAEARPRRHGRSVLGPRHATGPPSGVEGAEFCRRRPQRDGRTVPARGPRHGHHHASQSVPGARRGRDRRRSLHDDGLYRRPSAGQAHPSSRASRPASVSRRR